MPSQKRADRPRSISPCAVWVMNEKQILALNQHIIFLKTLFIFRQRGREGEREGEKRRCVVASHALHTGDLTHNPGMCLDWESNRQPVGSQATSQSTEPHQPGFDE